MRKVDDGEEKKERKKKEKKKEKIMTFIVATNCVPLVVIFSKTSKQEVLRENGPQI